jgi:hypothetical protein
MADDSGSVRMAIGTAVGGASIALLTGASCWLGMKAYRDGRFSRGWPRVRVWALGGVTTLGQTLAYDCAMCGHSLDQREEVRTLSCGHVFHLRKGPQVREQHRRLAPREPHALPGLLQARPPRVAVEGAADIGATARARATASAVGAVVVDFGFGGSGTAADGVGAGATAAAGVGPGATAVSAVDVVPGREFGSP